MDWVKLSARYYLDRAIAQLDDAGEVMFTRALAYAGDQETGGFIPVGMLHVFSRSRRYEATAGALAAAGLWLPSRGGYQITRWEEWQSELEAIARRRSADRDRKRRERAVVKAQLNGMSRDTSTDSPQDRLSSLRSGTGGIESREEPSNSRQAGGHRGQHKNCRACGTNPRALGTNPRGPSLPTPTPPPFEQVHHVNGNPARGDTVHGLAAKARAAIKPEAP